MVAVLGVLFWHAIIAAGRLYGRNSIDAFERGQSGGLPIGSRSASVTWITASCKEFCYRKNVGRSRDIRRARKRLNATGDTMGKIAMTSLKGRSKGWRTSIAPRILNGVDRTTNFATKVDLMIAQYSAENARRLPSFYEFLPRNLRFATVLRPARPVRRPLGNRPSSYATLPCKTRGSTGVGGEGLSKLSRLCGWYIDRPRKIGVGRIEAISLRLAPLVQSTALVRRLRDRTCRAAHRYRPNID